jgi:hypothetical protein
MVLNETVSAAYLDKVELELCQSFGQVDFKAKNYNCKWGLYPTYLPFVLYRDETLIVVASLSTFNNQSFLSQFNFPPESEHEKGLDLPTCLISYLKRFHNYIRSRYNRKAMVGDITILVLVDDLTNQRPPSIPVMQRVRPFDYFEHEPGYPQGCFRYHRIMLFLVQDGKVIAPNSVRQWWDDDFLRCLSPDTDKTKIY